MQRDFNAYETFFRFERLQTTTDLMRARSVYLLGWAFILTQFINIFQMTITYGGWITDHSIAMAAMFSIFIVMHALRYTHNFAFFAVSYSALLLTGMFLAAVQVNTGINSAVLPLMVAGCILNGFVGGARFVWLYAVASIGLTWVLYFISAAAPPANIAEHASFSARIFQRAAQTSLALILVSAFSAFISNAMNRLFRELESRIDVLETENSQKTKFLETFTQELQTPIVGVNTMSDQLVMTRLDPNQKKLLVIVRKCAKRLARLARDAGELSKIDSKTFVLREMPFNLRSTVKDIISSFDSHAAHKNVHIGTTYGAQLPEIYIGDEKRLKTVLRNILSNALKYTDAGSIHIYIDGRLKGADQVDLRIAIKDTGRGIAPENTGRVFERYEQLGDQTYLQAAGRGNGLAIAREFIHFMGGDIRVESKVGTGSNFEISLMLRVAENSSKHELPATQSSASLSKHQAA